MAVNNELGTINPIAKLGEISAENNILFHTDAVQMFGKLPMDLSDIHIDFLSMSAHKLYGPKGVGFLVSNTAIECISEVPSDIQDTIWLSWTSNNTKTIIGNIYMPVAKYGNHPDQNKDNKNSNNAREMKHDDEPRGRHN